MSGADVRAEETTECWKDKWQRDTEGLYDSLHALIAERDAARAEAEALRTRVAGLEAVLGAIRRVASERHKYTEGDSRYYGMLVSIESKVNAALREAP